MKNSWHNQMASSKRGFIETVTPKWRHKATLVSSGP